MALETFKAQLKAKAKTLGVTNLSNKRIDAYAATLEKQNPNLSTDDDHSEKVDAFLELIDIKEIAAYDDYKATKKKDGKEEKKEEKKETTSSTETEKKSGTETSQQTKQGGDDEAPAWFKKYQEENDKKIDAILKKEQQESVHQKITSNEKMKDIPEVFWKKRVQPEKVEDADAFVEEVVKDWEEIHPTEEGARRPALSSSGGDKGDGVKKASKEELDAVMKEIM